MIFESRLRNIAVWLVFAMLEAPCFVVPAQAQDAQGAAQRPLGDVARELRNSKKAELPVITNENFSELRQLIELTERRDLATGLAVLRALQSEQPQSPEVTCNFSFTAQNHAVLAVPMQLDLPDSELAKLDGPAAIAGDDLQVSVYNGTTWELQEITVGLTIVRRDNRMAAATFGPARLLPATAGDVPAPDSQALRRPDTTLLYHLKGSAEPLSTAIFKQPLGITLAPGQEWHWAILQARGIQRK